MTLPVTDSLLHRLGWDDGWEAAFAEHRAAGLEPARVAVQHRGAYDLLAEEGELRASAANRLVREESLPAVGDWVGVDPTTNLIEAVLPRRTSISRKEVWQATREQILAANVDVAFLVQALPLDFNVRRLERYLAMAWESGAQPVVLLTKTDLVDDVAAVPRRGRDGHARRVPGASPSRRSTGDGLDDAARLASRGTAPPCCSARRASASRRSSTRSSARSCSRRRRCAPTTSAGRHTTTRRELILLPGGGIVLDTPGIRELQLWDADLEQAFGDVEEIARRCRFSDCATTSEPGCAIREALADGSLVARALGELREAAARARGDRAAPQPPAAAGAGPGVQDSRTRESRQEEALTPPRVFDGRGRASRCPIPSTASTRSCSGRRSRGRGTGPPFDVDATAPGGSAFARPDADRLEYLLGIDGAFVPDPANPLRAPGPFGDKSVVEWPEYAPPGWLDSIADAGPVERARAALPPARRARARAALRDAGAARRGRAAARRPRRPRVRRVRGADALPRRDELGGADPAAPRGADPAGRPQRDVLGVGALRRRRSSASCCRELAQARAARQADRDGRESRRAGDAARTRAPPAVVRRPAAAVGQLLPPALGQAGVELPALPAHHAVRRQRAARRDGDGRSRSRSPAAPPRRTARTTSAVAEALGRTRATRRGSPRSATRTPGPAGATRSTRTCRR